MKSGALFGAFALVAACSSFSADSGDEGPTGADGGLLPDGAPAPVTGTFTGEVEITATVAPVTRNRAAKVAFTVKRGTNYTAPVIVRFEGLPATMTAEPLLVEGSTSTGEILLNVGKDTPIGPLRGPKLVATGQTDDKPTHSVLFETDVRGAPGEYDVSFGIGGVLAVTGSSRGSQFDVDVQGRIVVLADTTVRRIDRDGHGDDGSFIRRDFLSGPAVAVMHRGTDIFLARNKPAHDPGSNASNAGGELWKLNTDGSLLNAYGTAGAARVYVDDHSACAVDTDGRALSFNPPLGGTAPGQTSFTQAGAMTHTSTSKAAKPPNVRGLVFLPDHSAVFGGDEWIAKFNTDNTTIDGGFGSGGYTHLDASLRINDLVRDASGRFVVTGHLEGSKSLYVGRLTPNGSPDLSFTPQVSAFRVKTEDYLFDEWSGGLPATLTVPLAGTLTVVGNKIYQAAQVEVDGSTRCVVSRYLDDGTPDADFGDAGTVTFPFNGCYSHRIVRQGEGFMLVGGPVILRFWE